jgi:hypothetical protein
MISAGGGLAHVSPLERVVEAAPVRDTGQRVALGDLALTHLGAHQEPFEGQHAHRQSGDGHGEDHGSRGVADSERVAVVEQGGGVRQEEQADQSPLRIGQGRKSLSRGQAAGIASEKRQ